MKISSPNKPQGDDYCLLFEQSPTPYLVLSPNLVIAEVNDAYLSATMTTREELRGRYLFEAFPDDPDDPNATGVRNLRASLETVIRTGKQHTMAVQRYPIRRPEQKGGGFEERYWSPINTPILEKHGKLRFIMHRVIDVSGFVNILSRRSESEDISALTSRIEELGAELYARAQEIQWQNRELELQRQQQEQLVELAQIALSDRPMDELMNLAASRVHGCMRADFSGIVEFLPSSRQFTVRAGTGLSEISQGREIFSEYRSLLEFTLAAGAPVVMEDIKTDKRLHLTRALVAQGVCSVISVAIPGLERSFGVLMAATKQHRIFSPRDIRFLEALASMLATALELNYAQKNRRLALDRLISTQEEDRRRIARELHDESGQALTRLTLGLVGIERANTLDTARTRASHLHDLVDQVFPNLDRLAYGLHPVVLDNFGLPAALKLLVDEHRKSTAMHVTFYDGEWGTRRVPTRVELALYRIAQEALTNVARHSDAKNVSLTLSQNDGQVRLIVQDDGKGFLPQSRVKRVGKHVGLGIQGMRERAALDGGNLTIVSTPGRGTQVESVIPLMAEGP